MGGEGNGNGNGRFKLTFDQAWKIIVAIMAVGAFAARTEMNQSNNAKAIADLSVTVIASNQATAVEMAKLSAQNAQLLREFADVRRRLPRSSWRTERTRSASSSTARNADGEDTLEPWQ